ncbi:MAG: heavy metal-binding protein [Gammaproteobacteria bacterium]|nr:MAG: heavy metal-binding protein [Gammaproteobacteria bacterium]
MSQVVLKIQGMSCGHCVGAVRQALEGVAGVRQVEVRLEEGRALVEGEADPQALVAAVKEEGYEAELEAA